MKQGNNWYNKNGIEWNEMEWFMYLVVKVCVMVYGPLFCMLSSVHMTHSGTIDNLGSRRPRRVRTFLKHISGGIFGLYFWARVNKYGMKWNEMDILDETREQLIQQKRYRMEWNGMFFVFDCQSVCDILRASILFAQFRAYNTFRCNR